MENVKCYMIARFSLLSSKSTKSVSAGCLCQGDDAQSIPEAGDFVAPPQGFHDLSDTYNVPVVPHKAVAEVSKIGNL